MTLFDIVHPTKAHWASRYGVSSTVDESDLPYLFANYRATMPGIGLVCPADRLETDGAVRWVKRHGLSVAVHTSNQLTQLVAAAIEPSRMTVFAEGAQWGPIRCALNADVHQFVVESCTQIAILEHCAKRVQHAVVDVTAGGADEVIAAVCESRLLEFVGIHFRLDADSAGTHRYAVAVDEAIEQMSRIHRRRGIIASRLSIAGPLWNSPRTVAAVIDTAVEDCCARRHFPRPALAFTPDQSASPYSSNQ